MLSKNLPFVAAKEHDSRVIREAHIKVE